MSPVIKSNDPAEELDGGAVRSGVAQAVESSFRKRFTTQTGASARLMLKTALQKMSSKRCHPGKTGSKRAVKNLNPNTCQNHGN
jgi:hypothetical protein